MILARLLLLAAFTTWTGLASAAPLKAGDAPLEITSKQLEADDTARTVVFIGEVEARQGDLLIRAERLTVHYLEGARQVERIEADQNVRIIQGQRIATGEHAVYRHASGEVVLTGNPRINEGKDKVSGDRITVYLNDNRSVVDSQESGRVRATFHPRSKGHGTDAAR